VLRLKFRLMKENRFLYSIMILMSLVLTGVFSQSMTGDYVPQIGIVPSEKSTSVSLGLTGYDRREVTFEEGAEQVKNRTLLGMIYEDGAGDLKLMTLSEKLETVELKMGLNQQVALNEALNALVEKLPFADEAVVRATFWQQWEERKPIDVTLHYDMVNPMANYDDTLHYTIGMTLFFLTYSVMFTVGEFLEDKRKKTLDRMLVSPVKPLWLMLSNVLPGVLIGALQILVMVVVGKMVFGIDWGENLGIILLIGIFYVFAIASLSLLIVSLVKNIAQLGVVSPIILTGMGMIGGCMWPLEIVNSKMLLTLSKFTPHRWAIAAMEQTVSTGNLNDGTMRALMVLLIMGTIFLAVGQGVLYFKSKGTN